MKKNETRCPGCKRVYRIKKILKYASVVGKKKCPNCDFDLDVNLGNLEEVGHGVKER